MDKITKIKILSISKNERRSAYSFPRKQILFKIVRKTLLKLDFKNKGLTEIGYFGRPVDEEGEPVSDKEEKIKDIHYNESIHNYLSNNYSVEIIFFSKKVTLIFNYKKDRQQELAEAFEEFIIEEK